MSKKVIDIESSDLLQNALNYSTLPFKIKESYRVWCVVIRDVDTGEVVSLRPHECNAKSFAKATDDVEEIILHNGIGFDLPVLKLMGILDYSIGYPGEPCFLNGKEVKITDTLLWSKLLNADRFGGHSLKAWGKRLGDNKGDYNDWSKFTEEMLDYCQQDTAVTVKIHQALLREQGNHDWSLPYSMEIKLADLTLKQELFGFDFDTNLAHKCIADLTEKMQKLALTVDPLLPEKALPKTQVANYTLPKIRFKKDGNPSSHLLGFADKHQAKLDLERRTILFEGKEFPLDIQEPLKKTVKATIEDIDTVKAYLLGLGWVPSEVKEKDLSKNQDKTARTQEQFADAIKRYVKQTETSLFRNLRCDTLDVTFERLERLLMQKMQVGKPLYVPATPKLTVGVEKEICPNLVKLGEKAAFVKGVVEYYTYRHRKNSIAGGTLDEDGEPETGFLSCVREDGRIPTPADTLGANTGRYRHKIVCNIPRVTSLYGEQMRSLFGSGKGLFELGYDFASLEARIMGHHVYPYEDGAALAESLVSSKPNDIHSLNAKKLGIDRSSAKSFSYAAIYGAQPKKLSKMLGVSESKGKALFEEYWKAVPALKQLKDRVEAYWDSHGKTYIPGIDGRLLQTRSKHSLINVLFQSGGAILAKWSAVWIAQEMERLGILGDPFVHTKGEQKVWWMTHQHDEQAFAVHPRLMSIKGYATEEEAKEAVCEGSSPVGHGSKGTYVGFKTLPIECIDAGIQKAVKQMKLKVPLGFEWQVGLNWAQTH